MANIKMKKPVLMIKAFTLLETLLTLSVMSFIVLGLSFPVTSSYRRVQEHLFFTRFEHLYRHQQKVAILQQEKRVLTISSKEIRTEDEGLKVPDSIRVKSSRQLVLDHMGGNHSLTKLTFETGEQRLSYQFYLGSGNYQKTSERLHSP